MSRDTHQLLSLIRGNLEDCISEEIQKSVLMDKEIYGKDVYLISENTKTTETLESKLLIKESRTERVDDVLQKLMDDEDSLISFVQE